MYVRVSGRVTGGSTLAITLAPSWYVCSQPLSTELQRWLVSIAIHPHHIESSLLLQYLYLFAIILNDPFWAISSFG